MVSKVIGDVVDPFVPSVNMSVNYGSNHVSDGIELKPSMTGDQPAIHIGGNEKDMYTLVLTDPDVPGPDNPFDREFLHWVVVNIPGGTEPCQGEEVVSYVRPAPPIGIHRYVFVLFKQKGKFLPKAMAAPERVKFKTRRFADKHELGLPVAVEYFTAQKESQ